MLTQCQNVKYYYRIEHNKTVFNLKQWMRTIKFSKKISNFMRYENTRILHLTWKNTDNSHLRYMREKYSHLRSGAFLTTYFVHSLAHTILMKTFFAENNQWERNFLQHDMCRIFWSIFRLYYRETYSLAIEKGTKVLKQCYIIRKCTCYV